MEKNYLTPLIAKSKTNTKYNLVGSWRMGPLPFFAPSKISPCKNSCPLNQEIPKILELTKKQKYEEAWRLIIQKNPFPSTCGRICEHHCKNACNRQYYDGSVNFREIERFLGDLALKNNWSADFPVPNIQDKIAVIGAGPAGLAAAYFLTKKGISVEIFEKENSIGGMPKFIPSFRLPKNIFYGEIEQNVLYKNPCLKIFSKVNLHEMFAKNVLKNNFYKAVIIATGNNIANRLNVPTINSPKIIDALDFLKKFETYKKRNPLKIVIIGGGNTAVDAARTARRLYDNAKISIVMREDAKNIPAREEEIEFAAKEKIEIRCSATPAAIIEKRELEIEFNEVKTVVSQNGEISFKPKNNFFHETADLVITALGFKSRIPFLNRVNEKEKNKIFIVGDVSSTKNSFPHAIASAKNTADEILNFIETGKREIPRKEVFEIASINDINTAYFPKKPPFSVNTRNFRSCEKNPNCHQASFEELTATWEEEIVKEETERCFYCGLCLNCGNCFEFCPDLAIIKMEEQPDCPACSVGLPTEQAGRRQASYEIKKDYCKGCLICVKECPQGLIKTDIQAMR